MSLQTNLQGRLRNTSLPKNHGLMPVFEAVVNSIHAIEEKGNLKTGIITLEVIRENSLNFDTANKNISPIKEFLIYDNGCGFNEANFNSFETLDSNYKLDKGCRGLGRLMWLKAFDQVEVCSTYVNKNQETQKCEFYFNANQGIFNKRVENSSQKESNTRIRLIGFDSSYRKSSPSDLEVISEQLLEHILWYLVRDDSINFIVKDDSNTINLREKFNNLIHNNISKDTISINNTNFELTHIKFKVSHNKKHHIGWCAANRLVKNEILKIPALYSSLQDEQGDFFYTCYVTSDYLTDNVRSERTGFNIIENIGEMFDDHELSFNKIRNQIIFKIKEYLKKYLDSNINASRNRIEVYVDNVSPRYKPILRHINDEELIIDPNLSDEKIDLHLHSLLHKVEKEVLEEGHKIMTPFHEETYEDYKNRLNTYLHKVEDIKKSDLADYVMHRKIIIDLLQKAIEKIDNKKYSREDIIHQLIMPMRKESDELLSGSCNLWLIDERLAFHNYLASDKTLSSMPISNDKSTKEPDILSLQIFDNPILVNDGSSLPLASISVVEIKRPMRNDMTSEDKDPIAQSLRYLDRIRKGKVTTKSGRPIPANEEIPGFCYILSDLTETMINRCEMFGLTKTSDKMGYFGYNPNYKTYIEVISFDKLVKAAKERNYAFFEKLGLPIN